MSQFATLNRSTLEIPAGAKVRSIKKVGNTDGYDGHCLRAFSYFGEEMPDIEMAPESAECYTAKVGGTDIFFHSEEDVEYLGKQMKGRDLYELLTNQGL